MKNGLNVFCIYTLLYVLVRQLKLKEYIAETIGDCLIIINTY